MPVTAKEIEMYLGHLSVESVTRILAMGLTPSDLAEVARQIASSAGDDDMLDEGTIAELCLLVHDADGEELWADDQQRTP